uniref:Uncharacterized protein n=1 Tax=Tetranychus urticae TaxID=32264 RepID=T1KQQ7_TETUR
MKTINKAKQLLYYTGKVDGSTLMLTTTDQTRIKF